MEPQRADLTIYDLVKRRPRTNKDIMKETGKSQTAVSRSLKRLRDMNMVDFQRCVDRRHKLYVSLSESVHVKGDLNNG